MREPNEKLIITKKLKGEDGYKTFSLTVDKTVLDSPLKLGIEKSSPFDCQITTGVVHLGDNMFSSNFFLG